MSYILWLEIGLGQANITPAAVTYPRTHASTPAPLPVRSGPPAFPLSVHSYFMDAPFSSSS
jgi:hypothetical protein